MCTGRVSNHSNSSLQCITTEQIFIGSATCWINTRDTIAVVVHMWIICLVVVSSTWIYIRSIIITILSSPVTSSENVHHREEILVNVIQWNMFREYFGERSCQL